MNKDRLQDTIDSVKENEEHFLNWGQNVGTEARKSFERWHENGFIKKYFSGECILDIGYRGYGEDAHPILPNAIGVDLDYPGYDGTRLPFADNSQDTLFNSHTLEHISDYKTVIADWFRVIRTGGYLITIVPHQFLYERSAKLPSRWNGDHKRFYTAASLLREIEEAIDPIDFRVRYLEDNDFGFDYSIPPEKHAGGCYEIILVIEKMKRPYYADDLDFEANVPSLDSLMGRDSYGFVDGAYRVLLRREPDPSGRKTYLDMLENGVERIQILSIIAQSEEAKTRGIPVPEDMRHLT